MQNGKLQKSLNIFQDFSAYLNNHYILKNTFLTGGNVLQAHCTELQRMSGKEDVNIFCETSGRLFYVSSL